MKVYRVIFWNRKHRYRERDTLLMLRFLVTPSFFGFYEGPHCNHIKKASLELPRLQYLSYGRWLLV